MHKHSIKVLAREKDQSSSTFKSCYLHTLFTFSKFS